MPYKNAKTPGDIKHCQYIRYYYEHGGKKKKQVYRDKNKERANLYWADYRKRNVEKISSSQKAYHKNLLYKLRSEALEHYGGNPPRCTCCDEMHIAFLCINHINGGGNKHRKSIGHGSVNFPRWLKKNNYPSGFNVLCHNCNMAEAFYGTCPHEDERNCRER